MMKPISVLALVVSTLSLLPAPSFADNLDLNTQVTNQSSTIVGSRNVVITDTRQSISDRQQSDRHHPNNVGGISQRIDARTIIIGNDNIDIKKAVQQAIDGQIIK